MSDPSSNRVEAMSVWMTQRGPAILCGFGASFIAAGILDGMATASETQSGASHVISLAHLPAGLCLLLWGIAFSKNAPNGKLYALLALVFTPVAFFVNTESMLFGQRAGFATAVLILGVPLAWLTWRGSSGGTI